MSDERFVRFDSMPLPRAYFTPEGFLKDKPILTSCGIFEYTNPDGTIRRELRLPEDVFSPESLKSYKGKPVVISHDAGLIDKDNVAKNQIGTILSEGERSGDNVVADIIIHDTDAMKSAGLKELSLGYNLDLDETPGVWNGQRYDARQLNIRINHLALVREARAGEQARLNLDSRDQTNVLKGGKRMSKKITKTRHADAVLSDEEFAKAIDEYKKRRAAEQKADADEDEVPFVEEQDTEKKNGVEEQVAEVKARRDRRDEQGDPKDTDEAMGIIANQDEDIETLFNIIDTLLAKQDFDAAEEEEEVVEEEVPVEAEEEEFEEDENSPVNGVDDIDKFKKNTATDADEEEKEVPEEEEVEIEDDELVEDADDEEEIPDDLADGGTEEEVPEEEFEEDADEDEDAFKGEDKEELFALKRINTDSIDRIVSQKIALGELGKKVGLKNLAHKSVKDAKKAIILAVRPDMRLDGKTDVYINSAFDMARKEIRSRSVKDTAYQKKQMFNKDSADAELSNKYECSAEAARAKMIARQHKVSK